MNNTIEFKENGKVFLVEWDTYFERNSVIIDRVLVGDTYLYMCEAQVIIRGREAEWAYGYTVSYDIGKTKMWAYRGLREYQIGEKMYMPERIDPEMKIWDNSQEEIRTLISTNNENLKKYIKESGILLENYVEKYKKDLERIEEEERIEKLRKEEKLKEEDRHESIGDYNSRMGSSSTWFGDAGWMDE